MLKFITHCMSSPADFRHHPVKSRSQKAKLPAVRVSEKGRLYRLTALFVPYDAGRRQTGFRAPRLVFAA